MDKLSSRGWDNLPEISKSLYRATYFIKGEDYSGWLNRISTAYANDSAHADRISSYISNYLFHPSTPISSNGGTDRGLPISCYVADVEDSKEGIFGAWQESCWLGAKAGGIGRSWSRVRESGADIANIGKSSGIIPFLKVDGTLSLAVSQGGVRRMSQADYLDISHPEILEFIDIRKPTGDQNRRALELHHGVVITDAFMQAAIAGTSWDLISPKTSEVVDTVDARAIWTAILEQRSSTGEPYLLFKDTANLNSPMEYRSLGLDISTSNLCNEVYLHTAPNYTNICCLASINLEYWDEILPILDQFIADTSDFLDNVMQSFIDSTEGKAGFEAARKAAINERALGLGVMGLHSLFQKSGIPFESPMAKGLNLKVFKAIRDSSDKHQASLPDSAMCPMSNQVEGSHRRNIVTLAVAPTMSISSLCSLTSSGIEPWVANAFTKKLKQGSFIVRNKYLMEVILKFKIANSLASNWIDDQWASILKFDGSVQHLEWMDDYTKDVFKTAFEINQAVIIDLAGDRSPHIDQGQSLNLFIPGNSRTQDISDLHMLAWKRKLKGLYYLRSTSPSRASSDSKDRQTIKVDQPDLFSDACPSCT